MTPQELLQYLAGDVGKVLLGKEYQIKLSLTCLIAGGHLLLEDLPGMGKTTLSHALANLLGLEYKRVQFTSDLLPSDIVGISVFDQAASAFSFRPGPVFTQLLLADEINRSSPRTQSALLEAMAEKQVTVDGVSHSLPQPFFVIATQNPVAQSGTHPLPESQLDRFLMRLSLGYPDRDAEIAMYRAGDSAQSRDLPSRIQPAQLLRLQAAVGSVKATDGLLDYLQRLVDYTRTHTDFAWGISPRGGMALLHAAKAWALLHGRQYVRPEDLQLLAEPVFAHRLRHATDAGQEAGEWLVQQMLRDVVVVGS